ncbi:hypothetical protein PV797_07325 [Clostridiaceae bacterium M8S5]|nr:hypothetical protein PV797_07325 [Clostridiaceae bacterium M8S5]
MKTYNLVYLATGLRRTNLILAHIGVSSKGVVCPKLNTLNNE